MGIGAELITVAVCEGGLPRFVRTVSFAGQGGHFAGETAVSVSAGATPARDNAVALSRGSGGSSGTRLEAVVSEVRSSLEYLLSQSNAGRFQRVLITGGGAMLPGVSDALGAALGIPVAVAGTPLTVDAKTLGLDEAALDEASCRWLSAIGLALWGTGVAGGLSLLPPEVAAKRRQRQLTVVGASGMLAIAVGLAAVSVSRVEHASRISNQINSANAQVGVLNAQI